MHIDTDIAPVRVEIEGREYPLAPRTARLMKTLKHIEETNLRAGKPHYAVEMEQLKLILGREAAWELFGAGGAEDLDRLDAIYYGVLAALETPGRQQRAAYTRTLAADMRALAEAVRPLVELAALLRGAEGKE